MTADQTLESLNQTFGLPGVLAFELHPGTGMVRAQVTLPCASATVYLHGSHMTHWQPTGQAPVLFLSERSEYAPNKAIRGGIPICFPWFGPRPDGLPGGSHGFARISEWQVAFAALVPGGGDTLEDAVHLTLTLEPNELSRSLGFTDLRAACEFRIGNTLELRLSVVNLGQEPLRFEEALHSYFHVRDVRQVALTGLEAAHYLDKTDDGKQKATADGPLRLTGRTDRVFAGDTAEVTIVDQPLARSIVVTKQGSATTVVWNPWSELAATLADLEDDAWTEFVCVEAANTGADAITLARTEAHTMQLTITSVPH